MPQELQVLRCYSCHFFQVHIVKKSRKWECKMCGEKQSMKKVYGRGSGQDCRAHVQKLNKLAALQQENQISAYGSIEQSDHTPEDDIYGTAPANFQNCRGLNPSVSRSSKWSVFLDKPGNEDDDEEENKYKFGESLEHNAVYSLKNSVESMENGLAMYDSELTAFRNEEYYQTQHKHLDEDINLSTNSFKNTPNLQEDLVFKSSQNKWLKYMDKTTNIQMGKNVEQVSDHNLNLDTEKESVLFKRSNTWDTYLDKPTYEGSNLAETSAQLLNYKKIPELTQVDHNVQSDFPNKTYEKQMLPRKDIMNVNEPARDCSAFERDYNEDELNSILDI